MPPFASAVTDAISIHAPHARSDPQLVGVELRLACISIHAPHARSDGPQGIGKSYILKFQSTLLMRGATHAMHIISKPGMISIHAPHARSDS
mgnify:CR=1 FL=1